MYQDGQTATNPQTGEKIVLRGGQWVPAGQSAPAPTYRQTPGRIYGAPKPPDPIELERLDLARRSDSRAATDQARQESLAPLQRQALETQVSNAQAQQSKTLFDQGSKLRDDYTADKTVQAYTRTLPAYMSALQSTDGSPAGDLALTYAFATVMDPNSAVREGEQAMVSSSDTLFGRTVAQLKNQMDRSGNFSPELRKDLLLRLRQRGNELRRVYDSVRSDYEQRAIRTGLNPADVITSPLGEEYVNRELEFWAKQGDQNAIRELAERHGGVVDGNGVALPDQGGPLDIRFNGDAPPDATGKRYTAEQEAQIAQAVRDGDLGLALSLGQKFSGNPPDDATIKGVRAAIEAARKNPNAPISIGYSAIDAAAQQEAERARFGDNLPSALKAREGAGLDAGVRGLADLVTFGLADEAAAAARTLGGGTLRDNLQLERAIDEADTRVNFKPRLAGQILGGFLNPIGRGATTPGQMAVAGAKAGGLYGLGSGEGVEGRAQNALLGAGGGALGGYLVGKGQSALSGAVARRFNTPERLAAQEARAIERADGLKVVRAGKAENVPVSRAMLDPALDNQVTAAQATFAGGPIVDRSLRATSGSIEGRVAALGEGGVTLEPPVAGDRINAAALRFIRQSGEHTRRLYDQAEALAGDARVFPRQAFAEIDGMIQRLDETPNQNAAELTFLRGLRGDLDAPLSVAALRDMRTTLRKRISSGALVFGQNEARVLGVMDRVSDDIAAGLRAAGRNEAAQAFTAADTAYRQRMQFIDGTVQKLIGKRNSNMTPEQTFSKFQSMASPKGDANGFRRMMHLLAPEERADIAATFASRLGRNNRGDFTTAQLLSQAQKLPDDARRAIFGAEGAESLNNLLALSRAHSRVYSSLNHSRSGVAAMGRDYRSWLSGLMGIGTSAFTGDASGLAVAAMGGAATLGKDTLAARALMSRDITRWLRQAPRTTAPDAINAHLKRLSSIVSRNPQLAAEVGAIEQQILSAIRQLPGSPSRVVAGEHESDGREKPKN